MIEDQNNFNNMHSESHTPVFIWIILIILLLSVVGFGTLYLYQVKQSGEVNQNLQSQIAPLKNEVDQLQQEKTELNASLEEAQTQKETNEQEPLFYSLDGVPATVTKEVVPFNYTAENLESRAVECNSFHQPGYFDTLIDNFKDTQMFVYTFKYTGEGQEPNTYTLKVLPNIMKYKVFYDFKNDFDICAAGGEYTARMNSKWLLMESSCGSGYSDGSGKPIGCSEIREKLLLTADLQ